jgi:hypothetical protein
LRLCPADSVALPSWQPLSRIARGAFSIYSIGSNPTKEEPMEPTDLSDDELAAELRKAKALNDIADNAGEADASALWSSVIRSIEFEQRRRAGK